MPRIPHDPTKAALLAPGERETVFGDASYRAAGLDALCAECARLAYVDFDVVPGNGMRRLAESLALVGFAAPTPLIDRQTGTEAFATVTPEGRTLVSFRGTQPRQAKDLLTDGKAWLGPWRMGGQAHRGFSSAFNAIATDLAKLLPPHNWPPPIFTGHSLGAALATLAASVFKGSTLVTFGSPRVGDAAFVATLRGTTIRRYVDCSDFVTKLPPAVPGFYTHCDGDPLVIDRAGTIRSGPSAFDNSVDQWIANLAYLGTQAWRWRNVPLRTAADHAPINYIRAFT